MRQKVQETGACTGAGGGLSASLEGPVLGMGPGRHPCAPVDPLCLLPPGPLQMESFIPGPRTTFWEANPSSPEILPTVL